MKDLNHTIHRALTQSLENKLGTQAYDMIDLIPIPNHGDKMVRLRTVEEALGDFNSASGNDCITYLVQVKLRQKSEQKKPAPLPPESIFLPNGKLNLSYLIANASILMSSGEYQLARNIYTSILHSGERTGFALFSIARTFEAEGKPDEAEKHFEQSITYQPSLEAYQRLSAIYISRKKDLQAAELMERAFNLKDLAQADRVELHKASGNCWLRAGKPDNAETHYKQALALDSASDVLLSNLGALCLQSGRAQEARQYFQRALASNPKNDKALSGLGSISLAEGEKKAAHDYFASSLELNLNNPTAIYYLVKCAYEIKSYATAARIVSNYTQVAPININLLYSLAGLQFHLGRIDEARATTTRILEMQPQHQGASELLQLLSKYSSESGSNG